MLSPRWVKVVRDLWDNKSRTLLVVASVAVGVIAFGGMFATRTNLLDNLSLQFEASNAFDVSMQVPMLDDDILRWVRRQAGVLEAQALTVYQEELVVDGAVHDVLLYGFRDFDDIRINRLVAESGSQHLDRDTIFLERSYLSPLGLDLGDSVTVQLPDDRQHKLVVTGTVHDINTQPGAVSSLVQGYVSQRTLHLIGLSDAYNTLYLRLDRNQVDDPINYMDNLIGEMERRGISVASMSINHDREHWAANNVNGLITILIVVGFFSLILSGFLVVNTISGLMAQQRKQIGIMKIIGASRRQIITIYVVMVIVFGVLAVLVALPTSSLMARGISNALGPNMINFDIEVFQLPLLVIAAEVTVALMAPLISAIGPVWSGTRVTAAQAISDYNVQASNNMIDILLARVSGMQVQLLIPLRNTFRRKLRLLMTIITLTLAGAFFIAIMNVRAAMTTDVIGLVSMQVADIQVFTTQPYNARGLARRAATVPSAGATEARLNMGVTRVRADGVESEPFTLTGLAVDSPFIQPDLYAGEWLDAPQPYNRHHIVLGHTILENEPDIEVGDTITLRYAGDEQEWYVAGFVWANNAPGSTGVPAYSYYESVGTFANMPDMATTLLVDVLSDDRAVQSQVVTDLLDTYDRYNIGIANIDQYIEQTENILTAFNVIFFLLILTAVMIAIVGGLGLAGTMSLSVLERTREIGVMRSVGASTKTLWGMFVMEGIIIGLISFVVSLMIAYPFTVGFAGILGNTIRDRSWSIVLSWTGPVIWLVIVVIVSIIASLLPAQRATQISIREALSYE